MSDLILNNVCNFDYGYKGGTTFKTIVSQLYGGGEQRLAQWSRPLRKYSIPFNNKYIPNIYALLNFFEAHKGQYETFYFYHPDTKKDWLVTDGYKVISNNSVDKIYTIYRPFINPSIAPLNISNALNIQNDITITVDGVQWYNGAVIPVIGTISGITLNNATGEIAFTVTKPASNAIITLNYPHLIRVRFSSDVSEYTESTYNVGSTSFDIIEVK